jgi:diguanylate cyclase (GGDEF)-like protein
LAAQKREGDALGRMGGDEFCLVLPETAPDAAAALAQRILEECGGITVSDSERSVRVTTSIGISQALPADSSLDSLFSRADAALYRSKHRGRNRYEIV